MRDPRLLLGLLLAAGAAANAFFMVREGDTGDPAWWREVLPLFLLTLAPLAVVGVAAWLAGAVRWRRMLAWGAAVTVVLGGAALLVGAFVVDPQPLGGIVFIVMPVLQLIVGTLCLLVIGGSRIHEHVTSRSGAGGSGPSQARRTRKARPGGKP